MSRNTIYPLPFPSCQKWFTVRMAIDLKHKTVSLSMDAVSPAEPFCLSCKARESRLFFCQRFLYLCFEKSTAVSCKALPYMLSTTNCQINVCLYQWENLLLRGGGVNFKLKLHKTYLKLLFSFFLQISCGCTQTVHGDMPFCSLPLWHSFTKNELSCKGNDHKSKN